MKIRNAEAFIIGLVAIAVATLMLILGRGEAAIWTALVGTVVGVFVKSPMDWGPKD